MEGLTTGCQGGGRDGGWLEDEALFTAFYRAHVRAVYGFFEQRVGGSQVALDLTAEAFAQAFASRRRFRGTSDEQARAWLFGIASHLLAGQLRRGYAERRLVRRLGIEVPAVEDELERVAELDAVRRIGPAIDRELGRLSAEQRDAVRLRVVEELGYPAIAERLGISEPAARMRVSRGLSALAGALTDLTPTTEELR